MNRIITRTVIEHHLNWRILWRIIFALIIVLTALTIFDFYLIKLIFFISAVSALLDAAYILHKDRWIYTKTFTIINFKDLGNGSELIEISREVSNNSRRYILLNTKKGHSNSK